MADKRDDLVSDWSASVLACLRRFGSGPLPAIRLSSSHARARNQLTRRWFCHSAALTTAGFACLPDVVRGRATAGQQSSLAYPPRKIEGAERVLPGSFLYFSYPKSSDTAVLLRISDGEYLAYSRRCAHLGCTVEFDKARRCLACPCHRGAYDSRTGYVLYGPPPRPLDQIVLQVRAGGEVWAVGKVFAGDQNASINARPNSGGSN